MLNGHTCIAANVDRTHVAELRMSAPLQVWRIRAQHRSRIGRAAHSHVSKRVLMTLAPELKDPYITGTRRAGSSGRVRRGFTADERVTKKNLCALIRDSVPSGRPLLKFSACKNGEN